MQTFDPLCAAELAGLAAYARAVLGRAVAESPDIRELRVSATSSILPGLAVVEWELVRVGDGLCVAGGDL